MRRARPISLLTRIPAIHRAIPARRESLGASTCARSDARALGSTSCRFFIIAAKRPRVHAPLPRSAPARTPRSEGTGVHVGLQHEARLHAHASSRGRLGEVPRRVCVVGRAPRRSPGASGTRGCSPRSVVPRADVRARGTHRASETLTGHALSQEAARGEPLRATQGGGHAGFETARRERGRVRTL